MLYEVITDTPLDRRGFLRIASRYGLTSTAFAAANIVGPLTLANVAQAASATADARNASTPLRTLTFGASGFNENNLKIQESGQLWFANQLETRTNVITSYSIHYTKLYDHHRGQGGRAPSSGHLLRR